MKTIYLTLKICLIATVLNSLPFVSTAVGINVASAGKISGKIQDANSKNPSGNLTVSLFSSADSTLIAGTLTDAMGKFSFCMLDNGDYFLEIGNPGYKTKKIEGVKIHSRQSAINLGDISFIHCRHDKRKKNRQDDSAIQQ